MQRVLFATVFSLLMATALPAEFRKWTAKEGDYSTEAELVDQDDTNVVLKKRSGEFVTVPQKRLSDADRRYLRELKKKTAAPKAAPPRNEAPAKKELPAPKEASASYARDVYPFMMQYCATCHQPGKAADGYDLTSYAALMRRGGHGVAIVPGKLDGSRAYEVLRGMSKSMPPRGSLQPTPEEIDKVRAWILAGAVDDSGQPPAVQRGRGPFPRRTSR